MCENELVDQATVDHDEFSPPPPAMAASSTATAASPTTAASFPTVGAAVHRLPDQTRPAAARGDGGGDDTVRPEVRVPPGGRTQQRPVLPGIAVQPHGGGGEG